MLNKLAGKKTYIAVIVGAILGGAQAAGYVVPDHAFTLLGAFGLYGVRSAIGR